MDKQEKRIITNAAAAVFKQIDDKAMITVADDLRVVFVAYIDSRRAPLTNRFFARLNKLCINHGITYAITTWDLTSVTIYYKIIMYTF